jgi:hypothetical protein
MEICCHKRKARESRQGQEQYQTAERRHFSNQWKNEKIVRKGPALPALGIIFAGDAAIYCPASESPWGKNINGVALSKQTMIITSLKGIAGGQRERAGEMKLSFPSYFVERCHSWVADGQLQSMAP